MAEEIITSTNAETATDHEYNASEIQVLKPPAAEVLLKNRKNISALPAFVSSLSLL